MEEVSKQDFVAHFIVLKITDIAYCVVLKVSYKYYNGCFKRFIATTGIYVSSIVRLVVVANHFNVWYLRESPLSLIHYAAYFSAHWFVSTQ